jgi:hypothetical protein
MKLKTLAIWLLCVCQCFAAFTEFYCNDATGSNLNSGSTESGTPVYTATNGGWDSGTGVFTPASGDPSASVSVGMFASVYLDGATTAVFIGRVTAVDATTVTVSTTAKSGTAPTTNATGRSMIVGGCWNGPAATEIFPLSFAASTMTDASGNAPRVNFKNNDQYDISVAGTNTVAGPIIYQGYTTTPGDGGKAVIGGLGTGASVVTLGSSGLNVTFADFECKDNGSTGASACMLCSADECVFFRCVAHDSRGTGLQMTGNYCVIVECEAYDCNQSNTASTGGIQHSTGTSGKILRCVSHNNTQANTSGIFCNTICEVDQCIAFENGSHGVRMNAAQRNTVLRTDAYDNGGDGFSFAGTAPNAVYLENCNALANNGWGVSIAGAHIAIVNNIGYGAGTMDNDSGTITLTSSAVVLTSGSFNYASDVTPWVDPAGGDFTLTLAAAIGSARGNFTQTEASNDGPTLTYPDMGAVSAENDSPAVGNINPFSNPATR